MNTLDYHGLRGYNSTMKQRGDYYHIEGLGNLVSNIQSLEFALRAFLVNEEITSGKITGKDINLKMMNKGAVVSENAFTNYDTLGSLIKKYNENTKVISAGLTIDETINEIRDAIAHGRVSGQSQTEPLKLIKFDQPRDRQVEVTFSELMTEEWFARQIYRVYEALSKVSETYNKFN
ncbi:hypothetical protein ACFLX7_00120 [Chloroflexota bacterium]